MLFYFFITNRSILLLLRINSTSFKLVQILQLGQFFQELHVTNCTNLTKLNWPSLPKHTLKEPE